ncbi:TetR/AcrR family transcriptional regulator [Rhodococcus sp. 14C212]|uniref:ScbR family autoregulator-binding transcription factor n=1 Tax=Rhodococcus sp. 14C212 TaxID=2711209 RepID=UPI0013EAA3F3|nr:ScbR family autoregulator-binding transcription factor [Rhodococcus sp. 14C212]NGP08373.1 TetR/AcrR family transcriptional regulator [Rhodococcus sp. 14C212]
MPRDSVGAATVESAATPAGRPAQQRAIRTRQQILLAAAQLFADNGINGTALAEAAASAEVTKGALTFHFPTKDALVQALITEQEQRTLATIGVVLHTDAPALEQLVALTHALGRLFAEDLIVQAGLRLTGEYERADPEAYRSWITVFEGLFRRAAAEGELSTRLNPKAHARFLVSAVAGVYLLSMVLAGRADLEVRLDQMWELLLPGIVRADRHDRIPAIRAAR